MKEMDTPLEVKLGVGKVRQLLEKYPESRYLRLARIARYHEMERRVLDRQHPDTGEPSNVSSEDWPAFAAGAYRRMAQDLASETWGPFEDVRLMLIAEYAKRGGDAEGAERAKQEVLSRFGNSRVAQEIRSSDAKERELRRRDERDRQ